MDDAKALLDSLMGPSRDKATKEKKTDEFTERNVCKFYLVCWCPANWFENTRREQKPCTKLHSDHLKEQFEKHGDHKKYKLRYEKEFLRHLELMVAEADSWVAREKRKCRPPGKEVKIPVELKDQYNELEKEYSKLLEEAEKTASESIMQQADEKKSQIDTLRKLHTKDFGGEEVCEVCGVRYPLTAVDYKIDSGQPREKTAEFEHTEGKVHKNYQTIRDKVQELKERLRQEENNQDDEKDERSRGRDRKDRSRSRRRDGDKKDGQKDGDEAEKKKDDDDTAEKKDDRKDGRRDRDDRGRDKDDRKDDRRGRRDSPRRDNKKGDDRGRRRRDDSRDRGRRRSRSRRR